MALDSFRILTRKLTEGEIRLLMQLIRETPNITGYSYREWQAFTNVLVAESGGKLAGVCVTKPLYGKWYEIAVLYVLEEYRAHGIGSELFKARVSHTRGSTQERLRD